MSNAFDTIFPADSLEFCPTPGFQDLFVCGTYKLLERRTEDVSSVQKRRGQCLLFRTQAFAEIPNFQMIYSGDFPAIPDMKWSPSTATSPLLAVADSEGSITLHSYCDDSLTQTEAIRCASTETLCLSLDWSHKRFTGSSLGSLVVSLSNGSLCLLSSGDGTMSLIETWHAHDFEPWIAAWDCWDTNVIYSGGDDLKLKAWDVRQGFANASFIHKRFEAGVTTIQSHPFVEHLLAVGSYDDTLRLFDTRKPTTPLVTQDVGGGVWRAKWHPSPSRKGDILLACMHDGFKIVRFPSLNPLSHSPIVYDDTNLSAGVHNTEHYTNHDSLAYGADWSHDPEFHDGKTIVGCCSFYDHKMSLFLG